MTQYLITGGEGFIGGKIAEKIQDSVVHDIKSGKDILNKDELEFQVKSRDIKGIFHCAALISVPESIEQPAVYYRTNVEGTKAVIEVVKKVGAKIVFSSSAAVYGELNAVATEESPLMPQSPYAENKREGELLLQKSSIDGGVAHIALRYFNAYGPGQSPQYAGVITAFIKNAIAGADIVIYGDGKQVRDFVYVDDIAEANIKAMNYKNDTFEIFNIGSGEEITIQELAEMIIELTGSSSKIIHKENRAGDIIYSKADTTKAREVLGWAPKVSLREGLMKTIESYK